MPCQYCSFPQTKGEWWDWGFGLLLPRRTKWRQIMKKLWTSGNGPSGACWGHHLEMCYSSYILWTNNWLTVPLPPVCIFNSSVYRREIRLAVFSFWLIRSTQPSLTLWAALYLRFSTLTTCFHRQRKTSHWRRRLKTTLNKTENELQNTKAQACVISCGRRSRSYVLVSGLNQGELRPEHMSHTGELWGWSRDRHVCVCVSFLGSEWVSGCSPYGFMWSPGICGGVSPCWNGSVL